VSKKSNLSTFLHLHADRKFAREVVAAVAELDTFGISGAESMAQFAKGAGRLKKSE